MYYNILISTIELGKISTVSYAVLSREDFKYKLDFARSKSYYSITFTDELGKEYTINKTIF